jgi:hypothetical protein
MELVTFLHVIALASFVICKPVRCILCLVSDLLYYQPRTKHPSTPHCHMKRSELTSLSPALNEN